MGALNAIGRLDRRVTLQRKTTVQDPDYGTPVETWATVATLWANIAQDLPSKLKSEIEVAGVRVQTQTVRLRMRYMPGVTSDMRVQWDGAYYKIVAGPAEIGRRQGLEMMIESFSTEGQAA